MKQGYAFLSGVYTWYKISQNWSQVAAGSVIYENKYYSEHNENKYE